MSDSNFLNDVKFEEAMAELGQHGIQEIAEIARWLETGKAGRPTVKELAEFAERWKIRVAPSIVARSIADFFGVSVPRFAYRIRLGEDDSFVNAIRIATLCNEVRQWGQRGLGLHEHEKVECQPARKSVKPERLFRKGTCVGDSVLQVPTRLKADGFRTVEREFGRAHGEGKDIPGIPYVKSMRLSGLCAQACCFMITALLHRNSKGVFGVPEITRYADDSNKLEVEVTGLTRWQAEHYFQKAGLAGFVIGVGPTNSTLPGGGGMACFKAVVKGCLRSGFPIFFPIDSGRMAGIPSAKMERDMLTHRTSIYGLNGVSTKSRLEQMFKKIRERHHAVVGVGYAEDEIILHDPSCLPYMRATFEQMVEASPYVPAKLKAEQMKMTSKFLFVPVMHPKVQMPPSDRLIKGEKSKEPGLLNLAAYLQQQLALEGHQWDAFEPGELLAVRATADRQRMQDFFAEVFGATWPETFLDEMGRQLGDRWVWLQAFRHRGEVWIWDAQNNTQMRQADGSLMRNEDGSICFLPPNEAVESFFLARIRCRGAEQKMETEWVHPAIASLRVAPIPRPQTIPPEEVPPLDAKADVSVGMISSFAARGLGKWSGPWPGGHCNLYCFMQGDAEQLLASPERPASAEMSAFKKAHRRNWWRSSLFPKFNGILPSFKRKETLGVVEPRCNVLRLLSALPDMTSPHPPGDAAQEHVRRVAEKILRQLQDFGAPEVAGLSSYLPEISCDTDLPESASRRDQAVRAIAFLMHLGRELNPARCAQGKFSLEIVAGGLTNGIWPAEQRPSDTETPYIMSLRSPAAVMENFIEALHMLAPAAARTGVKISVECEPGPLNLLGTWELLENFCLQLPADLRGFVGLSADLAHWAFLKSIQPGQVSQEILSLIQCIHVSDHGDFGHFGDSMPFEIHGRGDFTKWLDLLCHDGDRFTGTMSGEFEAAQSAPHVREFARRLGIAPA